MFFFYQRHHNLSYSINLRLFLCLFTWCLGKRINTKWKGQVDTKTKMTYFFFKSSAAYIDISILISKTQPKIPLYILMYVRY